VSSVGAYEQLWTLLENSNFKRPISQYDNEWAVCVKSVYTLNNNASHAN